jgi:hypothetical protein
VVLKPEQREALATFKPALVQLVRAELDLVEREATTKLGFDGFVGADSTATQKDRCERPSDSQAPRDAWAWEWIEERAAIFEFEAGMDRNTANTRAFELWFHQFVGYN